MSKLYLTLTLVISFIASQAFCQSPHEAGFISGISSYNGDINSTKFFYAPSPTLGLIYKRNLNARENIRLNASYAQFRGADKDFSNTYQKLRGATFSASLVDIDLCYEVNFLPFFFHPRKDMFTTFMFGGIGWEYMLHGKAPSHFAIPFGVGVKYFLTQKITIGTELSFRKTFIDNIDGVENPGTLSEKSVISNKDWYSYSCFFITFRLFDRSGECPAYQ